MPSLGAERPTHAMLTHCFHLRHVFDMAAVLAPRGSHSAESLRGTAASTAANAGAADAAGRTGTAVPPTRHRLKRKTTLTEDALAAEPGDA